MYVLMMITTALVNRMEELGKEILEHNGLEELYESASLAYPSVVGQHIHSYAHIMAACCQLACWSRGMILA